MEDMVVGTTCMLKFCLKKIGVDNVKWWLLNWSCYSVSRDVRVEKTFSDGI